MKQMRNAIVLIGLAGVAGWLAYRYLLSDEAKKGMNDATREVKSAYQRISDVVKEAQGTYVKENLPNRKQTEAQWEALGF
ncbi:hypothetical protein ACULPM_06980 [Thermophilibacter sp. ZX-H3]|uniref:hypothetical protein n=1 Tax=unclassified Thermophilibacter TaxID=2847308 RepID=UPI004040A47A